MIDTTLSSFERDVIEASMDAPVLVEFWAPWCGPCQAMTPMLERLEREYGGRFHLVAVNADTNPELVSSFSLTSIPHAVAFVDGNAVAQFAGAQPEAFVRAFIDRLAPNPAELEHRCAREALRQNPGLPVIVCSGHDLGDITRSLGPTAHPLRKPIDFDEREALVERRARSAT